MDMDADNSGKQKMTVHQNIAGFVREHEASDKANSTA